MSAFWGKGTHCSELSQLTEDRVLESLCWILESNSLVVQMGKLRSKKEETCLGSCSWLVVLAEQGPCRASLPLSPGSTQWHCPGDKAVEWRAEERAGRWLLGTPRPLAASHRWQKLFPRTKKASFHTRLLHPWDFPGKSTGVGCHCVVWKGFPAFPAHLRMRPVSRERLPELPVVPREKTHTCAPTRENPQDAPVIAS